MNNMFSGNREKKIPKTFNDCYKTDSVTNNLWLWAERLETIGIVLAVIVGIAGFIIGLVLFEDSDGVSLLISFLGAPVAAFLEYISFHIIALLIGSLASIVQHTKISADLLLYDFSNKNINKQNKSIDDESIDVNENNVAFSRAINCPNCGKSQPSSRTNCYNCGFKFPESNNIRHNNSKTWRCEKCGNLVSSNPCVHCGHKKS